MEDGGWVKHDRGISIGQNSGKAPGKRAMDISLGGMMYQPYETGAAQGWEEECSIYRIDNCIGMEEYRGHSARECVVQPL